MCQGLTQRCLLLYCTASVSHTEVSGSVIGSVITVSTQLPRDRKGKKRLLSTPFYSQKNSVPSPAPRNDIICMTSEFQK